MIRVLRGAAVALVIATLAAAARADVEVDVALGHGGRWIADCATPVSVILRNDGTEPVAVRLSLAKSTMLGSAPLRHERAVFLGPGTTRREWFVVPAPESYSSTLKLSLVTDPAVPVHHAGETATRGRMSIDVQGPQPIANAAIPGGARVVGVVGDDRNVLPALLPNAERPWLVEHLRALAQVAATPVDETALTLAPFSIEGFDALVLIDPGGDTLSDPAALSAVLDWVALGGLLVVSPGSDAGSLSASPLGPWLPGRTGAPEQRDLSPLVSRLAVWTEQDEERSPNRFAGTWLPVEGATDETPYADRDLGAGRVRLLAFDARAALRACTAPPHFGAVADILAGRPEPVRDAELAESVASYQWVASTDVDESVGNALRRDAFDAPPLPVVLAALILYVLVVGPIDWIVLKRLGKQRLTTFTFGTAVLAFTALAYGTSFLVFSSGEVVNRLVLVDLVDAGREGRQLVRVHDVVSYYSPRGADRELAYPLPAVVSGSALPSGSASQVGSSQPVIARGADPLAPQVLLQVAFRSLRTVRTTSAGPTGRTIDAEWLPAEGGGSPRLRLTNGLPVGLERVDVLLPEGRGVYSFGSVPAGGQATTDLTAGTGAALGAVWGTTGPEVAKRHEPEDVHRFLGFLSRLSPHGFDGRSPRKEETQPLSLSRQAALARTGIARGDALHRGRALLLAIAGEPPLTLPATGDEGHTYVIVRKEIELP